MAVPASCSAAVSFLSSVCTCDSTAVLASRKEASSLDCESNSSVSFATRSLPSLSNRCAPVVESTSEVALLRHSTTSESAATFACFSTSKSAFACCKASALCNSVACLAAKACWNCSTWLSAASFADLAARNSSRALVNAVLVPSASSTDSCCSERPLRKSPISLASASFSALSRSASLVASSKAMVSCVTTPDDLFSRSATAVSLSTMARSFSCSSSNLADATSSFLEAASRASAAAAEDATASSRSAASFGSSAS
mmetsp:Transcript_37454/g.86401  ORF Transcript_37454/g.86401 Transcript_37454/m.86401 type:complete len:257 (+) Transcript_37454:818-1588(+)